MKERVRIIDIAKAAGVSKTTVSRALNDEYGINEETRKRVLKAVQELKYRFNSSARNLKMQTKQQIGIFISEEKVRSFSGNIGTTEKIEGIVRKAKKYGYDVMIFIEDFNDMDRLVSIIQEKEIEGVILVDVADDILIDTLESYHIPVILVNWYILGRQQTKFVKTDLVETCNLMIDYAIKKGHTEFGIINWEDKLYEQSVIKDAIQNRLNMYGISQKNVSWNTKFRNTVTEIQEFIETSQKKLFISFYHEDSIRIINYCHKKGLRMPEDIALISYDNYENYEVIEPRMTGIRQEFEKQGELSVKKLIQMINGKQNVTSEFIKPIFIIGETC